MYYLFSACNLFVACDGVCWYKSLRFDFDLVKEKCILASHIIICIISTCMIITIINFYSVIAIIIT